MDAASGRRALRRMPADQVLGLLAEVPYGRIVFVDDGEPAVIMVNHIVDDGEVVVRTHAGATVARAVRVAGSPTVVYQADRLDADRRLGWTVTVRGSAVLVADPQRRRRCEGLLRPWLDKTNDVVIAIRPDSVSGQRIVDAGAAGPRSG